MFEDTDTLATEDQVEAQLIDFPDQNEVVEAEPVPDDEPDAEPEAEAPQEDSPGAEVAVIESAEVEPLSEGKAKQLDKQIRAASKRVKDEGDKLVSLLEKAANGKIHVALGFSSWTAYIKEAVDITFGSKEERKTLVAIMSGKGMSQRAIAGTLGVSQKTVDRDLEGQKFESDKVTSLDGKSVPRTKEKKPKKQEIIDAEVISVDEPKRTATDMIEDFEQPLLDLVNDVQGLKDVLRLDADLLPRAKKRLAQRFLNRIQGAITDLNEVVDTLMT